MLLSPIAMHIPDGFLSTTVSIIFWVISAAVIAIALRKTNQELDDKRLPLMGVLAAAIFAGQMLNFTVVGGTSGHLMGAALATILLGPWAAILVMTAVVSTQALIFQDGGLLALGANLFNMGILGVMVAYPIYRLVYRLAGGKTWGIFTGGVLAAWTSLLIASLSCSFQLAFSGTSPANIVFPAMAGMHALIGIGEALITLGALSVIYSARRDLLDANRTETGSNRGVLAGGVIAAIALAIASPLASSHPDGLEWVAEQNGFIGAAREPFYNLIPDYVVPGISNEAFATILAGIFGALFVLISVILIGRSREILSKRSR